MKPYRIIATLTVLELALALAPRLAIAGPYGDELTKCLVRSTSDAEKNSLIKWMFAAMASHPEVKSMASISIEQGDQLNKGVAKLFSSLVSELCRVEASEAVKYEGGNPIERVFSVLGSVAMRDLMSHPDVTVFLGGIDAHLDSEKINAALGTK